MTSKIVSRLVLALSIALNVFFILRDDAANAIKPGPPGGAIIFSLNNGQEVLKFDPSGETFVHGKKVAEDVEAYLAAKEFFKTAKIEKPK